MSATDIPMSIDRGTLEELLVELGGIALCVDELYGEGQLDSFLYVKLSWARRRLAEASGWFEEIAPDEIVEGRWDAESRRCAELMFGYTAQLEERARQLSRMGDA